MRKFFDEFKAFALRGNVINLSVGVIIGAAFQGVVSSLTQDILSPMIGLFAGQNFDYLQVSFLGITLKYGSFITSILNFFIMAFIVFLLVRGMNKLATLGQKQQEESDVTKKCPYCMSKIAIEAIRCPECTSHLGL